MGHTLIITEKPNAAKMIAKAISDKRPKKQTNGETEAYWYEFVKDGRDIVVAPAAGHLFSLKQKSKGWDYPVFDVEWVPSYKANKSSMFSRKYLENLKDLAEGADDFIVACDYDQEGSVIGFNILKFVCEKEDASRMKFSTLTQDELINAYEKASKHLDKNQIEAGLTRHYLDWYWGINTTRALTLSVKNHGKRFSIVSAGRVQAPVLNVLAKREHEIEKFEPDPYWELEAELKLGRRKVTAEHTKGEFWDEDKVKTAVKKAKNAKKAQVKKVKKTKRKKKPPTPFDTTTLLRTINRYFGYTPKKALSMAESLYQKGLISYPRTSSKKLPKSIGYEKILKKISGQKKYKKKANFVLEKTDVKPRQGKKKDPAHPAVYPTGQKPGKLSSSQKKVYDLIVHRFLAVFGKPAVRESIRVNFDIGGEKFKVNGVRTIESNWFELYGRYAKFKEQTLPKMEKGKKYKVKKINKLDKETQPPSRYTQNSALKLMEDLDLGTKATRASILSTLYDRHYIMGKSIKVTELGLAVTDLLNKHVEDIVSEDMTRQFENETEDVFEGKRKRKSVLNDAKKELKKVMKQFKKKEKDIGEELGDVIKKTQEKKNELGPCPNCDGQMKKLYSRWSKKYFVGCSSYPDCKTGFPLPQNGSIVKTKKVCDDCNTPIIQVFRKGERPFRMCLDPECPTKEDWLDKEKLKKVKKKSRKQSKKNRKKYNNRVECPFCDDEFDTMRGLKIHTSRTHDKKWDKIDEKKKKQVKEKRKKRRKNGKK